MRQQLDEEMVHIACAHFERYGGSFNQRLVALWRVADSSNKKILMTAFKDLFMHGYNLAKGESK
jgi:hypothetical protein